MNLVRANQFAVFVFTFNHRRLCLAYPTISPKSSTSSLKSESAFLILLSNSVRMVEFVCNAIEVRHKIFKLIRQVKKIFAGYSIGIGKIIHLRGSLG